MKRDNLSSIKRAFNATKAELLVSLAIIFILTVILSIIFYIVEGAVQPNVFSRYSDALIWAYSRYIECGDVVADGGPVTSTGKVIASLFGLIGIAIVAIPAGLVGSGFIDAMEDIKHEKETDENIARIKEYFDVDCNTRENEPFWPARFERISTLQSMLQLSVDDILKAVKKDNELRLVNFAQCFPDQAKGDPMAVERFYVNTDYGYSTKNTPENSSVTVISMDSRTSTGTSYFSHHLARTGRFNLISNEFLGIDAPEEDNRCIVRGIYEDLCKLYPRLGAYAADMLKLSDKNGWTIVIDKTADADAMITLSTVTINGKSSDIFEAGKDGSVEDLGVLRRFYDDLTCSMKLKKATAGVTIATRVKKAKETYLVNWLHAQGRKNVLEIDLSSRILFDTGCREALVTLSRVINRHFETKNKFGFNLIPMEGLPVYRGREFDVVRLSSTVRDVVELSFVPIVPKGAAELDDRKARRFCFAFDFSSHFMGRINGGQEVDVDTGGTFGSTTRIITRSSDKQTSLKRYGAETFSIKGRLKQLMKDGKCQCTVTKYKGDCTLCYEFCKERQLFDGSSFVDNPFDAGKIGLNIEPFEFPDCDDLNGRKALHLDEITYDGMVIDGQIFTAGAAVDSSRTFEVEVPLVQA